MTNPVAFSLSNYVRVGRYDLPEPTRTTPPTNSLLAQEASAVTYNADTNTLFVVGDGGTSIVQVSLTGKLIDSMTLAPGSSPQGTEFYDTEGLTYVGEGKFVMVEERDRQAVLLTYTPNTTLTRADTETVKLGTTIGNIGLEGVSYDPQTGGFIFVKEKDSEGVFQSGINFTAGTATNGSPTAENATNLFDPTLVNVADIADVFALSNVAALDGTADAGNLLLLSQESGEIVEVDRNGNVIGTLVIQNDPGNLLSVVDQQHEGVTMDDAGNLYVVSENGGGDFDHPQLWVYAQSAASNQAPTEIKLDRALTAIQENSNTVARVKLADILITDDGLGSNDFTVSGDDAAYFEADNTGLYLKAGTVLDYETKTSYAITVNVDDASIGATPDASVAFTLSVIDVVNETAGSSGLYISEVAPWSSGNSPVGADWFEVTNGGTIAVDITGWKMDDGSASFGSAAALSDITSIAAGESVIFIESSDPAATSAAFVSTWFGANAPAGLQIGSYSGSGLGLSTGGDGVILFDESGTLKAKVTFGPSSTAPYQSFNNAAGEDGGPIPDLSEVGTNGAFIAAGDTAEIGSPGTVGRLFISEVAPWSSGNSPVGADWFEVTNTTAHAVDVTGWKMDDSSGSPAAAAALTGITTIAAGESVIFLETSSLSTTAASFISTWFGANAPAGLQIGSYSGSGVGLSSSGDAVHLYDAANTLQASVTFGASPTGTFATFDNAGGLNNATLTQLSAAGSNGAATAARDAAEVGSPGSIVTAPAAPYTLQILHLYGESGTLAAQTAPIVGAMIDQFRLEAANTLTLAEGDTWIPGPWLVAGADPSLNAVIGATALGRPDIAIMNALGVDASALGNHEFDLGSPVVSGAIAASGAWAGAAFPFITSNIDVSADSAISGLTDASLGGAAGNAFAGAEASTIGGKIAPYTIVTIGGEQIGIVGSTTYDLLTKTSPNGTVIKDDADPSTSDLQEVAAYIQASVDALTAAGVNKIVMVDQLDTIERNQLLAPLVHGIDVMVAGGGHERLGDSTDVAGAFNGHDASFVGSYPIVTAGSDGDATLIVTTDTEYTYLGRLEVTFDSNGVIDTSALDPAINGAYAANEATLQAVTGSTASAADIVAASSTGSAVQAITSAVDAVVVAKDGVKFGFSDVYLEGDRVYGRAQETNLGDVSADANAYQALKALGGTVPVVVSLKNGGGLRASIGSIDENGAKIANPYASGAAGNVSQLDVENALRFDNKLMVFDTTGQGLLNILNYGAGLTPGNGGFPQLGGLRFSYDPSLPAGSQVQNVALYDLDGNFVDTVVQNGVVVADAPATISVVVLNFTANGGDGYPIKANASNFRYLLTDNTLSAAIDPSLDFTAAGNVPANTAGEQIAFETYMTEQHGTEASAYDQADTPASGDLRIENLSVRTDAVLPGSTLAIAATDAIKLEGDSGTTPFVFTVTRSGSTASTATVAWSATGAGAGATAAAAGDLPGGIVAAGTLTFAPGVLTQDITVNVQGDNYAETDESFHVVLSGATGGAAVATGSAEATILNDDSTFAISADTASQVEGQSGATLFSFTVTRGGDLSGSNSIAWYTTGTGPNAPGPQDFAGGVVPGGTLSFAAGETSQAVTISVQGDAAFEADETFLVGLRPPTGGAQVITSTAQATILNDDTAFSIAALVATRAEGNGGTTPFTFTVTRDGDTSGANTVDWLAVGRSPNSVGPGDFAGGGPLSGTLSFAAGQTSKIITLNVQSDLSVEQDEQFQVLLRNASAGASIAVNHAEGAILNDDGGAPAIAGSLTQVAAADFNGDATADLLRQGANRELFVLDGASGVMHALSQSSAGLAFLAAADLNGDGRADLLLQDNAGGLYDWTMNGDQVMHTDLITTLTASQSVVAASGASASILLHDTAPGAAPWTVLHMDGAAVLAASTYDARPIL
jgi:uncharacterized protein YjiK/2',3'-cyclic-nucleotide 2'-phosphodiesterase (5'-nucleotidase family)